MRREEVVEVAPDVFCVQTAMANWHLLREGSDITLVDAGYPGQTREVEASIRLLGHHPKDVRAVLVTHAHADHLGAVGPLHTVYGTPALAAGPDASRAQSGRLDQVRTSSVLQNVQRPGVATWAVRALRLGGTRTRALPHVQSVGSGTLDLPGRPVPVATPGHTDGHTAYHLPMTGVLLTGDALVTAHPCSRLSGPQLLPAYFDHDRAGARQALTLLGSLDADVILPGHGPVWHGRVADAVSQASTT